MFLYLSKSTIPSNWANSVHVMKMANALSDLSDVILVGIRNSDRINNISEIFDAYSIKTNKIFRLDVRLYQLKSFLPGRLKIYWFNIASIIQVAKNKPKYLYGRNIIPVSLGGIFVKMSAVELHSPLSKISFFEKLFIKIALKLNSSFKVFVISSALRDMVVAEGLDTSKVFVAHDAADDEVCSSGSLVDVDHGDTIKIGYIGSLYPGRGIEVILKLASEFSGCEFHIVGGPEIEVDKLHKFSGMKNIFLHGHLTYSEATRIRLSCNILLAPYQEETTINGKGNTSKYMSPLKIFEYMSAGKVILCSDFPVLREVLNESNSLLIPSNDFESWRDSLRRVLADGDLRDSLSKKSREDFIKMYTWKNRSKYIFDILEKD